MGGIRIISETKFNMLLLNRDEALKSQLHLGITKINTLRMETEAQIGLYGLKLLFAKDMFEYKAKIHGCETVEEYINRYDFPEEERDCLKRIVESGEISDAYQRSCQEMMSLIEMLGDRLSEGKLKIQSYTRIKGDAIYLEPFLAGDGIYYGISKYGDEDFESLYINEKGELCIEEYSYEKDRYRDQNRGKNNSGRDFRKYTALENMHWIISHLEMKDEGTELWSHVGPGINVYIGSEEMLKLLSPNLCRDLVLLYGMVVCEEDVYLTDFDEVVFA